MSRAGGENLSLGDEGRFELAMAAAAQEKRNRPVLLPGAAVLVLAGSLVFAVWALLDRNSALEARTRAQRDEVAVAAMSQEWKELGQQEQEVRGQVIGERMPNLFSKMEELARNAQLKATPANPRTSSEARENKIVVNKYDYANVKDTSLTALMEWVRLATGIPGMEVVGLKLKAEPSDWSMDVTFRRMERAG